ncbi:MAG TPA: hypothetical protein VER33_25585 [Polyangiaceae bacterium]|nr:hypothetical protein [Polyangiaceae bacterium]
MSLLWTSPVGARAAALAVALGALASCAARDTTSEYRVGVRIQGDPGRPLPGAFVGLNGKRIGASNQAGLVTLAIRGTEGTVLSIQVTCPEGYRSPTSPLAVILRQVAQQGRHPEYVVSCPPTQRTLVVAVRAEQGAHLPVLYLGREVARTDATGTAHVLLRSAPEETVELTLDTTPNARLRPRSPSARFRVGQSDELVLFNQSFEMQALRQPKRQKASGPIRIR